MPCGMPSGSPLGGAYGTSLGKCSFSIMPGAKLNDVLTPARIRRASVEHGVEMKVWPNGRTTARRNWASPLHRFEVEFDGISLAEWQALKAHYDSVSGQFDTFTFEDTHDGTEYVVRYDNKTLERRNATPNSGGVYKVRVKLVEHK